MTDTREAFLRGERPTDVALFLSESVVDDGRLERFGERVDGGFVIVVDGERGRNAFRAATGMDAMEFAGAAMDVDGVVEDDLAGGRCPDGDDHEAAFVFAFVEGRNEEVGGLYAEGDVVHAYAMCECDTAYSDRWVVDTE